MFKALNSLAEFTNISVPLRSVLPEPVKLKALLAFDETSFSISLREAKLNSNLLKFAKFPAFRPLPEFEDRIFKLLPELLAFALDTPYNVPATLPLLKFTTLLLPLAASAA